MPLANPLSEERHLGHFQNGYGESGAQLEALVADTTAKTNRLPYKRLQTVANKYIANTVLLGGAAYRLRFMNTSAKDIARVAAPVKKLLCERSGVHMSVPDSLKYGLRGGMGWVTWGDKVNCMRVVDLMVAIMEGGTAAVLMRSELQRLQLWVGTKASAMTLQPGNQCVEETAYRSLWSVGLWQWMMNGSRELQFSGRGLGYTQPKNGDRALQESPHIHNVAERDQLRTARWRWQVCMVSDLVAMDGRTLLPEWWFGQARSREFKQEWRLVMMAANVTQGTSLATAVPKQEIKVRSGSAVITSIGGSLVIAK